MPVYINEVVAEIEESQDEASTAQNSSVQTIPGPLAEQLREYSTLVRERQERMRID